MIEDDIDHEIVDFSIVTSSGPSSPLVLSMFFMVVPTKSSSSESSEFFTTIQQVIFSAFPFTSYLELRFDVCHLGIPYFSFFHH